MRHRTIPLTLAVVALLGTAGCTDFADYDERMNYLRNVAQRGADTHTFLKSQEATVDKPRCERAFEGVDVDDDAPAISSSGDEYDLWIGQIKEFFVDSCVSGKPKPVPGDAIPSAPASASPEPSASD